MPTYAYRCNICGHQFEIIQKITDQPLEECPECKGKLAKLLFPVGIVFKGSGFHVNDYPSSSRTSTSDSPERESASTKTGKEAPAASKASGDAAAT